MVGAEEPFGPDHRDRVVEHLRVVRVALREPEQHVHVVLARELDDVVGGGTGDRLRQALVELARVAVEPAGVALAWGR